MTAPIKVPLRGGQTRHLLALQQQAVEAQRAFEATIMGIASEAELPDGAKYTVAPVLDGPEPHVLLTPEPPPKKG